MSRTQSATLVFGAEIFDTNGAEVGRIQDLIVDLKSGQVIYAIISFSDEIGDNKYFPLPVKALKEDPQEEEIFVDIQKSQLKNAPRFEHEEWPKAYDEKFIKKIYNHYGYEAPN